MIQTLLITWRESLEAALIVGILLTYLRRSGMGSAVGWVWFGAGVAAICAVGLGTASGDAVAALDPDTQEIVQAGILFAATAVLTWMVLWMHRNARGLRGDLHRKADEALATGRRIGLAGIAFVAVFREGLETVLFLFGIGAQHRGAEIWPLIGAGVCGIVLAIGTAMLFFRGFQFLSLRTFFRVTGTLLLLVAGGLLTAGVNKLIGLGYLPPLVPQLWNTSWLVRDDSIAGAVLGSLVGYRSRPSLLEVLALVAYLPPMFWALRRADRDQSTSAGRGPGGAALPHAA